MAFIQCFVKMSLSVEKLMEDAKLLVSRLGLHDESAEVLAQQACSLRQEIEAHNGYQETLRELNKAAGHRPRSNLIMEIQQENCAIRSLQRENNELCQMLKDQQNAMDLIMTKYREQLDKFKETQDVQLAIQNKVKAYVEDLSNENNQKTQVNVLVDKVYKMANVMNQALEADDNAFCKENDELSRLKLENQGLKELVLISNSHLGAKLIKDKDELKSEKNT